MKTPQINTQQQKQQQEKKRDSKHMFTFVYVFKL